MRNNGLIAFGTLLSFLIERTQSFSERTYGGAGGWRDVSWTGNSREIAELCKGECRALSLSFSPCLSMDLYLCVYVYSENTKLSVSLSLCLSLY